MRIDTRMQACMHQLRTCMHACICRKIERWKTLDDVTYVYDDVTYVYVDVTKIERWKTIQR